MYISAGPPVATRRITTVELALDFGHLHVIPSNIQTSSRHRPMSAERGRFNIYVASSKEILMHSVQIHKLPRPEAKPKAKEELEF